MLKVSDSLVRRGRISPIDFIFLASNLGIPARLRSRLEGEAVEPNPIRQLGIVNSVLPRGSVPLRGCLRQFVDSNRYDVVYLQLSGGLGRCVGPASLYKGIIGVLAIGIAAVWKISFSRSQRKDTFLIRWSLGEKRAAPSSGQVAGIGSSFGYRPGELGTRLLRGMRGRWLVFSS